MFAPSRNLPVPVLLTVIGLGAFVTALDQTVVVTALPAVMLDLKIPIVELDRVSWVITAYLLGYTVAMPLIGRLADVYGYSRVYQVSLVVFIIGTSLVAVAGNLEWMIGARVIQAIGGGATVPIGMAIAANALPPEKRGLALGIVGGAAEAGSMHSPLCNFCRTRLQDRYQERVLRYFEGTQRDNLIWLTVLDDLIYDPGVAVPERIKELRLLTRRLFNRQFQKQVRAFGAFEIDVKRPDQVSNENGATDLLRQYGLRDDPEVAYMPHLHAIIALDGISADDFGDKLRTKFQKPSQVSIGGLWRGKTKSENLATLARYSFKFRYQFADNILRDKPSYGKRFDDETLRSYTRLVHSIKGQRGVRGFEFMYNL